MARTSRSIVNEFFRTSPPVEDSLPIELGNGSVVETLDGRCSRCDRLLDGRDVRGVVLRSYRGLAMTAFGFCERCDLLTPLMCDVVRTETSFKLEPRSWRGWSEGDVVSVKK